MSSVVDQLFSTEISEDRMHAFLKCCKLGGYSAITAGQVVAVMESASIEITDQVTQRILDFTERVKRSSN